MYGAADAVSDLRGKTDADAPQQLPPLVAATEIALPPRPRPQRILLFDVDGTLTPPRAPASPALLSWLRVVQARAHTALVTGSDASKVRAQLGADTLAGFDYVFSENGTVAHKRGRPTARPDLAARLGGERGVQRTVAAALAAVAEHHDLDPHGPRRAPFVEVRAGLLNVAPQGRGLSREERAAFAERDRKTGLRVAVARTFAAAVADLDLDCAVGGEISFDVCPRGWDKTLCVAPLAADGFTELHFFGDKTHPGGNDHTLFSHPAVRGYTVRGWEDTMAQVNALLERESDG